MKRLTARLLLASVSLGVGVVTLSFSKKVPDRPAATVLKAGPRVSLTAPWRTLTDTVRRGEPLVVALERAGVPPMEATRALLASSAIDARRVRAGTPVTARTSVDSGTAEIVFHLAIDRLVRLRKSGNDGWTESEELLPWTIDTVAVGGMVQSTLTNAIRQGAGAFSTNVRDEVAYALADILEYRVDLSRELQKGDTVMVLVERKTAPNGLVQAGNILAARLTVAGKRVETVRFEGTRSSVQYFDGDGKSMRAAFLRAPLSFRRISSVFGMRKHPILGIWRAHQGTDYSAASGTPVRALGDGTIIFAGTKGGYGRTIEIRHRNGMVTRYGHLKGFAKGIKRGASVRISSTVGYVGATGLATAPHLHFEVLINGKHRDPRTALSKQTGDPLGANDRTAFARLKSQLFTQLDRMTDDMPVLALEGLDIAADPRHASDE